MRREYWRAWRDKFNAVPKRLEEALQWVGIEHGRAATYKKLLVEYSEGNRSNEHFFAYYQATELLSIFESWRNTADDFPGIKDKISFVFKKGALLSENESASANSNRPRNDAFVYFLAGKMLHGEGVNIISVDGIKNIRANDTEADQENPSDIVLSFRRNLIRIECKRPMNRSTLDENVEAAFRQITARTSSQAWGLIAIDASKIIERAGEYLEASSLDIGSKFLTDELEKLLTPVAGRYNRETMLGFMCLASIPLVTSAKSKILKCDGTPYTLENLCTAAVSYLSIKNSKCPKGHLVHELQQTFMRTTHDVPGNAVPMV